MKRAGVGGISVACRVVATPPDATPRADAGAWGGVKRPVLLELQWQDRGGRFRHLALRSRGLRQMLGAVGIVAMFALIALAALFAGSNRAPATSDVAALWRENTELKARQDALRERAFDLAEQLYRRVERGRRMTTMADTLGAWEGRYPRPPARDAGDEAILAWLSEQGARIEAIGDRLMAGRDEMGTRASREDREQRSSGVSGFI